MNPLDEGFDTDVQVRDSHRLLKKLEDNDPGDCMALGVNFAVERETDKAVLLRWSDYNNTVRKWFPKSVLGVAKSEKYWDRLVIAIWFVGKENLWRYTSELSSNFEV